MKLFDYKFILLILLSIIVYYLYIEIDKINARILVNNNNLNVRIEKMENKIKNQPKRISMETVPQINNKLILHTKIPCRSRK